MKLPNLSIFTNMFSLLNTPADSRPWPLSLVLPQLFPAAQAAPQTRLISQEVVKCPHHDQKHYAKSMCRSCYHKYGRDRFAWACVHKNRRLYAKGRCHKCYLKQYYSKVSY
mmetsp:Transcript_24970/g.43838  ORF Transcript_24970/g.43838 Transcript_24970/m.43838 type:complete len:111 (+) Transcript_24970:48-380(+)